MNQRIVTELQTSKLFKVRLTSEQNRIFFCEESLQNLMRANLHINVDYMLDNK